MTKMSVMLVITSFHSPIGGSQQFCYYFNMSGFYSWIFDILQGTVLNGSFLLGYVYDVAIAAC